MLAVIKKNELRERIYIASYAIYLTVSILNTSFYAKYLPVTLVSGINILCLFSLLYSELLFGNYTIKQLSIVILLSCCACINWSILNTNIFVMLIAYIVCAREVSFFKIAKISLIISITLLMFIIASSFVGSIDNVIEENIILGVNRRREYLGFLYALFPSAVYSNIVFLIIFLYRDKLKLWHIITMMIGNGVLFYLTDARLNFLLLSLFLIIVIFNYYNANVFNNKICRSFMCNSFILCAIISIAVTYLYDSNDDIQFLINLLLEGRLSMGQEAIRLYGINLVGNYIEWAGAGLDASGLSSSLMYFYVDCVYVRLLVESGILMMLIYISAFSMTLIKICEKKNFIVMLILAFIAVHGVLDDLIIYIQYNTFLLLPSSVVLCSDRDSW